MTRAITTIPFHDRTFIDDVAKIRDVEARWKTSLKRIRQNAQGADLEAGKITEEDAVSSCYLVKDADRRRIKRRAMRLLERVHSATDMYHLGGACSSISRVSYRSGRG